MNKMNGRSRTSAKGDILSRCRGGMGTEADYERFRVLLANQVRVWAEDG